jgi:hypothetical protein
VGVQPLAWMALGSRHFAAQEGTPWLAEYTIIASKDVTRKVLKDCILSL